MKDKLWLFLAGALLLGVAAGYWFDGSQAENDPGSAQETDLRVYLDNFVVRGKCYDKA